MYKKWIKQAERQGWQQKKIKHGVLLIPRSDHKPIALHNHHSRTEGFNMRDMKAELKRAGLKVDGL